MKEKCKHDWVALSNTCLECTICSNVSIRTGFLSAATISKEEFRNLFPPINQKEEKANENPIKFSRVIGKVMGE